MSSGSPPPLGGPEIRRSLGPEVAQIPDRRETDAEDAQGMSPSLETRMVDPMRNRLGSGFPLPPRVPSGRRYWWTSTTQLPVASR